MSSQTPEDVLTTFVERVERLERFQPNYAPLELHMAIGAAEALAAVGALSADAAAAWMARLHEQGQRISTLPGVEEMRERMHGERSAPAPSAEMRSRAEHHLERLLRMVEMSQLAPVGAPLAIATLAGHGAGAADAFRAAGLLDQAAQENWTSRFNGFIQSTARNIEPAHPTAVDEVPRIASTPAAASESFESSGVPPVRDFQGTQLQRVLQVQADTPDGDIPQMVEFYEDGLIVRYLTPFDGTHRTTLGSRVALADDLDTQYWCLGGGGGSRGSRGYLRYESSFVPAVPATAAELRLTLGDKLWKVPLE